MSKINVFLNLIKFEHTIFALPFAYLGLFLAEGGLPRFHLFFWVTVAMIAIRTSAMCLNRLIDQAIEDLKFDRALNLIWEIIDEANKKIDAEKPWVLAKDNPQRLKEVINQLLLSIAQIAYQIDPFMPETSWSIIEQLKSMKAYPIFPRKQ